MLVLVLEQVAPGALLSARVGACADLPSKQRGRICSASLQNIVAPNSLILRLTLFQCKPSHEQVRQSLHASSASHGWRSRPHASTLGLNATPPLPSCTCHHPRSMILPFVHSPEATPSTVGAGTLLSVVLAGMHCINHHGLFLGCFSLGLFKVWTLSVCGVESGRQED